MNYKKYRKILLFLVSLVIFIPCLVKADLEYKPPYVYDFVYEGRQFKENLYIALYDCIPDGEIRRNWEKFLKIKELYVDTGYEESYSSCNHWIPIATKECDLGVCKFDYTAMYYSSIPVVYSPELDKVFILREYNVHYAPYNGSVIDLKDNKITKNETSIKAYFIFTLKLFLFALIVTLFTELFIVWIYLCKTGKKKKILCSIVFINLLSLPFVWYIFPLFVSNPLTSLVLSEIFIFSLEAVLIKLLNRRSVNWFDSICLSLIMNFASLVMSFMILEYFVDFFNY